MTHQEVSIQNILVPLDGSAMSEQALPVALDLATKYSARVTLLRIVPHPETWTMQNAPEQDDRLNEQEALCLKYLREVQSRLGPSTVPIHAEYALGSPSQCIVDHSHQADCSLVVMNSHGRDGLTRWLLGSVAEKVARHAGCPVLLLRQPKVD